MINTSCFSSVKVSTETGQLHDIIRGKAFGGSQPMEMGESAGGARPDVSVVVPVYNAETYLEACLDSVLNQAGVALELVCVDDCGADGSPSILERYAARDPRVTVIRNPRNLGLSRARNVGMDHARGQYLVFLDADDCLLPGSLAQQVEAIQRDGADVVYFHTELLFQRFADDPAWATSVYPPDQVLYNAEVRNTCLRDYPALLNTTFCWSYIYDMAFIERHGIRFDPELARWEDRAFCTRVVCQAERVSIVPRVVRQYRRHAGGITGAHRTAEDVRLMVVQLHVVLDEFDGFLARHANDDTRAHRSYVYSFLAFWVATFIWKGIRSLEESEQLQQELLLQARGLLARIEFEPVRLEDVEVLIRSLRVDVPRVALVSGALWACDAADVLDFLKEGRTSAGVIDRAEEVWGGRYVVPRKRFERRAVGRASGAPRNSEGTGPTLVIHLGLGEIGTPDLYRLPRDTRERLADHGIWLLRLEGDAADRAVLHGGPGFGGSKWGPAGRSMTRDCWASLIEAARSRSCRTVVVAAGNGLRGTVPVDPQTFRDCLSGFGEVRVVVTLQSPDDWFEGFYRSRVVGGWSAERRTFRAFLRDEQHLMDFPSRLAPWVEAFGADAIRILPPGRKENPVAELESWLRCAGLDTEARAAAAVAETVGHPGRSEPSGVASLPAELVEATRQLNLKKQASSGYRKELQWLLERWAGEPGLTRGRFLEKAERERIRAQFRADYVRMLERFGADVSGDDPWPEPEADGGEGVGDATLRVDARLMADVMSLAPRMPTDDPVIGFLWSYRRRIRSMSLPQTAGWFAGESGAADTSASPSRKHSKDSPKEPEGARKGRKDSSGPSESNGAGEARGDGAAGSKGPPGPVRLVVRSVLVAVIGRRAVKRLGVWIRRGR